mgnify:FL=1
MDNLPTALQEAIAQAEQSDGGPAVAARALGLMDLTSLNDTDSQADIDLLCTRAISPAGAVAAVCVNPDLAGYAKRRLDGSGVKVATVVNFPAGLTNDAAVIAEIDAAVQAGADEIDAVLPQDLAAAGATADIERRLSAWQPHCGGRPFKIILESGLIADAGHLRAIADAAIAGGADMLKTSTGKGPPGASMAAAAVFCQAVLASERAVGVKLSGGIRTAGDAGRYLGLVDALMGVDWVQPNRFRFGASGLLTALLADLGHPLVPEEPSGPPATPAAY